MMNRCTGEDGICTQIIPEKLSEDIIVDETLHDYDDETKLN